MTVFNVSNINGVPFESNIIPKGNSNRPAYAMSPKYITVHTTENTDAGANARQHAKFVNNGGGSAGVSWHFTVDDTRIVQHLPINENGWHAGDGASGTGNRQSIGIETCENSDGNFEKALANVAKLVKFLMTNTGIGLGNVVPHQRWSGKYCPRPILNRSGGFDGFKKMVEGSTNTGGNTIAPPTSGNGKDAGTQGLGIVYIEGANINLRNAPSTNSTVLRKLNNGESYIVWAEKDGWLNLGGDQWVYGDPSYITFARRNTGNAGKLVVVKVDELWVYSSADWNDKEKTVKKGEAFTIVDELMVNGSKMYKCKYFYITASPSFVDVK
ncbi:N-acetylmuramoyl-L-alanine amidase [Bacillus thuringiensis]|uniref:N-acetylmuramoyl-L-alanine amidase n=1 Tax=Bacillus thuringiensis TaxID=1428 RepID=UPI000BFBE022|nr:N-acetylmuramoyl-L-alanine amidase [Bacillus thuringiensis]PGO85077.1 N-acetylmuramoyl-L-alanine amidase [Bacillus thuringiensis]